MGHLSHVFSVIAKRRAILAACLILAVSAAIAAKIIQISYTSTRDQVSGVVGQAAYGENSTGSQNANGSGYGIANARTLPPVGATDALTQSLIDKGVANDPSGNPLKNYSKTDLTQLTNDYTSARDKYIANEIENAKLSSYTTDSVENTKAYMNGIADAYYTSYKDLKKNDIQVVAEAADNNFDMTGLDPYIAATENLKTKFLALKPPLVLKTFHEQGLKIIVETLFDLNALRNTQTDPFAALIALQYRNVTRTKISQLYDINLAVWVKQAKISFDKDEIGHIMFGW